MAAPRPKLVLFIRALTVGGAERQVLALAEALTPDFAVTILTLYDDPLYDDRRDGDGHETRAGGRGSLAGVHYEGLGKRGRFDLAMPLWRFWRFCRRSRPDVLYAFLPTQTVLSALLKPVLPCHRLVFGLRSSLDYRRYDWANRLVYRLEAALARRADLIIANAEAGRAMAVAIRGIPGHKIQVIDNLIDGRVFYPARRASPYRAIWRIDPGDRVIGCVARLDPMKGLGVFLAAAALFVARNPHVRFVLVGTGSPAYRADLVAAAIGYGLMAGPRPHLIWVDPVAASDDAQAMNGVYNAFDLATLTSLEGEGFPNAVAEAMAAGVPVVASDVGDCARIVGDTGRIVPPGDAAALADAWAWMLAADHAGLGGAARRRIETVFDRGRVVEDNRRALWALLGRAAVPATDLT